MDPEIETTRTWVQEATGNVIYLGPVSDGGTGFTVKLKAGNLPGSADANCETRHDDIPAALQRVRQLMDETAPDAWAQVPDDVLLFTTTPLSQGFAVVEFLDGERMLMQASLDPGVAAEEARQLETAIGAAGVGDGPEIRGLGSRLMDVADDLAELADGEDETHLARRLTRLVSRLGSAIGAYDDATEGGGPGDWAAIYDELSPGITLVLQAADRVRPAGR